MGKVCTTMSGGGAPSNVTVAPVVPPGLQRLAETREDWYTAYPNLNLEQQDNAYKALDKMTAAFSQTSDAVSKGLKDPDKTATFFQWMLQHRKDRAQIRR